MDDDMYQFSPTASPRDDDDDDGHPGNQHPLVPDNAITPKVPKRSSIHMASSLPEERVRKRTLNADGESGHSEEENFGAANEEGGDYYRPIGSNFENNDQPGSFAVAAGGGLRASSRTSNYSPIGNEGGAQPSPQPPALGGAFRPALGGGATATTPSYLPPRGPSAMGNSVKNTSMSNIGMIGGGGGTSAAAGSVMTGRDRSQSTSMKPSIATQLIRGSFRGGGSALGHAPVPVVVSTTPSEIKTAGFTTEDRRAASKMSGQDLDDEDGDGGEGERLFVPGVKREQFIPVRVAREKIKEVLSEMAHMKHKHLAAIETMEKQHQYLKNQLETACAAYAKKLTNDYNTRVSALDAEYCRRLARLSGETAAAEVEERLRTAREAAKELEREVEARLEAKDKEMENFKAQLTTQLDRERSHRDELQTKLMASEERCRDLEIRNSGLTKELDAFKDGVPLSVIDHAVTEERLRTLQASNDQLQQEVAMLKRRHDEETLKLEEEVTLLETELNRLRESNNGDDNRSLMRGASANAARASTSGPAYNNNNEYDAHNPSRVGGDVGGAGVPRDKDGGNNSDGDEQRQLFGFSASRDSPRDHRQQQQVSKRESQGDSGSPQNPSGRQSALNNNPRPPTADSRAVAERSSVGGDEGAMGDSEVGGGHETRRPESSSGEDSQPPTEVPPFEQQFVHGTAEGYSPHEEDDAAFSPREGE